MLVYDANKQLVAASGKMGNNDPAYPPGVLDYVSAHGEDRITWQPQERLRFATIAMKSAAGGYIVAGQSLQETEKLAANIGGLVLLAWGACTLFSAAALAIIGLLLRRLMPQG